MFQERIFLKNPNEKDYDEQRKGGGFRIPHLGGKRRKEDREQQERESN